MGVECSRLGDVTALAQSVSGAMRWLQAYTTDGYMVLNAAMVVVYVEVSVVLTESGQFYKTTVMVAVR